MAGQAHEVRRRWGEAVRRAPVGLARIVSRHGQMATIPAMLLGRYGMQLRAPAISVGEVAQASYGGKARVPLTGQVEVQE